MGLGGRGWAYKAVCRISYSDTSPHPWFSGKWHQCVCLGGCKLGSPTRNQHFFMAWFLVYCCLPELLSPTSEGEASQINSKIPSCPGATIWAGYSIWFSQRWFLPLWCLWILKEQITKNHSCEQMPVFHVTAVGFVWCCPKTTALWYNKCLLIKV